MQIYAEIHGIDETLKRLDHLDHGLSDRTPFLKQAGTVVLESTQRNFVEGGRPKWEPLSWVTPLLRATSRKNTVNRHGLVKQNAFEKYILNAQVLRDTGVLMASIGNPSGGGIYDLQRDSITVGTALKKARPLQEGVASTGGMIPGKRIPPRPFMFLQPVDKSRIYDMAVSFTGKRIEEARR